MLQRAVRCCNAPCDVATRRAMLQRAARCCNAPYDVATRRTMLQHVCDAFLWSRCADAEAKDQTVGTSQQLRSKRVL
jgi:hypothetical protein